MALSVPAGTQRNQQHLYTPSLPATADPPTSLDREQWAACFRPFPRHLFLVEFKETMMPEDQYRLILSGVKSRGNRCFSVASVPTFPNKVVVEADTAQDVYRLLNKKVALEQIKQLDHKECIDWFCAPVKCLRFQPGRIVRMVDHEFSNDAAQIVDIDNNTGRMVLKLYPHIDYDGLQALNVGSQRVLNARMHRGYRPPPVPFDEPFLKRRGAMFSVCQLQLKIAPGGFVNAISWDDEAFIGKFQYVSDIPMGSILADNLNISEEEFSRFEKGMAGFELINDDFVRETRKTKVVRPVRETVTTFHVQQSSDRPAPLSKTVLYTSNLYQPEASQPAYVPRQDNWEVRSAPLQSQPPLPIQSQAPLAPPLPIQSQPPLPIQSQPPLAPPLPIQSQPPPRPPVSGPTSPPPVADFMTFGDSDEDLESDSPVQVVSQPARKVSDQKTKGLQRNEIKSQDPKKTTKKFEWISDSPQDSKDKDIEEIEAKDILKPAYSSRKEASKSEKKSRPEIAVGMLVEVRGVKCKVEDISGQQKLALSIVPETVVGPVSSFRTELTKKEELCWESCSANKRPGHTAQKRSGLVDEGSQFDKFAFLRLMQSSSGGEVGKKSTIGTNTSLLPVLNYRPGDLVMLLTGKPALVISCSRNGYEVLQDDGNIVQILQSRISKLLPSQASIQDAKLHKICLNDQVMLDGASYSVVSASNNILFLRGADNDYRTCEASSVVVVAPPGTKSRSLVGAVVWRLRQGAGFTERFRVTSVSSKGFLVASNTKHTDKFKFNEHKKTWRFEDEIQDKSNWQTLA